MYVTSNTYNFITYLQVCNMGTQNHLAIQILCDLISNLYQDCPNTRKQKKPLRGSVAGSKGSLASDLSTGRPLSFPRVTSPLQFVAATRCVE